MYRTLAETSEEEDEDGSMIRLHAVCFENDGNRKREGGKEGGRGREGQGWWGERERESGGCLNPVRACVLGGSDATSFGCVEEEETGGGGSVGREGDEGGQMKASVKWEPAC